MSKIIRVAGYKARGPIRDQQSFKTSGSLRGEAYSPGSAGPFMDSGEMPEPWRAVFLSHVRSGLLTYVVLSYRTPIAWVHDGQWYRPNVTYSVTTAKHQGQCPAVNAVMVIAGDQVMYGEEDWSRRVRAEVMKTDVEANEAWVMFERRGDTLYKPMPLRGLWSAR